MAFNRFDANAPDDSRFVDEDFNRVWTVERLNGTDDSVELRRARELRPFFETVDLLLDILSWILLVAGSGFLVVGSIGMIRLPDLYARMHAVGIIDTLGAALLLIGLALQAGLTLVTVKLFLILLFLLFTSPTATYALANAAYRSGLEPLLDKKGDEPSKTS